MTSDVPNGHLASEGVMVETLWHSVSQHVINLVADPQHIDAAAENLPHQWNGVVKQLIMDYCPLGDAYSLIERFHSR
jgi:hypothetical protein